MPRTTFVALVGVCCVWWPTAAVGRGAAGVPSQVFSRLHTPGRSRSTRFSPTLNKCLALRGGVRKAVVAEEDPAEADDVKEGGSPMGGLMQRYKEVPLATRCYLTSILACTMVDLVAGSVINSAETFALDWKKTVLGLELWRPFTAASFLGPPSMHMATNIFFLIRYGQQLEAEHGTAELMMFWLVSMLLLNLMAGVLGLPFTSTPLICAAVYASSRLQPFDTVPFQFGLSIPQWTLPFAHAAVDVLQAQQPAAAIPHVLGILAGHFYHFYSKVYPAMGGRAWLHAPGWMKRRLDTGNPNFMEKPVEDARPAGRKLGGAKKVDISKKSA